MNLVVPLPCGGRGCSRKGRWGRAAVGPVSARASLGEDSPGCLLALDWSVSQLQEVPGLGLLGTRDTPGW